MGLLFEEYLRATKRLFCWRVSQYYSFVWQNYPKGIAFFVTMAVLSLVLG
jgi:hypothetical protein